MQENTGLPKFKHKIIIGFMLIVFCLVLPAGIAAFRSKQSGTPEEDAPKYKEHLDISLSFWDVADYLQNDALQKQLEDQFNVTFVPVNVTYMNWTEEFLKMAVSNTLPDIICHDIIGTSTYSTWVEQGLIRPIPKDLSAWPNLEAYLSQDYNDFFRDDTGTLYCIPRITYDAEDMWALDRCIIVRKDWLDTLGLSMPRSFEEFETMLSLFVNNDPDRNGLDDTTGLGIANMNTLEAMYLSIFPEFSNVERGWIQENGLWMPVYCSEKAGRALACAKDIYDKNLLDYDFAYQGSKDARINFALGKSGAVASQYLDLAKEWEKYNPGSDITEHVAIMHPWPAEDGKTYRFTTSLHWSETYLNHNLSEEKYSRILDLYDYLLSDAFTQVLEEHPVSAYPSAYIFGRLARWDQTLSYENKGVYIGQYSENALAYANQELDWYRRNTTRVDYNWDVIFLTSRYKNQLPSYKEIQNEMIKVILGTGDAETDWQKALDSLREKTTLNQAIAEVTAIAGERGWQ